MTWIPWRGALPVLADLSDGLTEGLMLSLERCGRESWSAWGYEADDLPVATLAMGLSVLTPVCPMRCMSRLDGREFCTTCDPILVGDANPQPSRSRSSLHVPFDHRQEQLETDTGPDLCQLTFLPRRILRSSA